MKASLKVFYGRKKAGSKKKRSEPKEKKIVFVDPLIKEFKAITKQSD